MKTNIVYGLHFEKPIGSSKHKAQHYIGSCINLRQRLNEHWTGKARCAITKAFYDKHIPFTLAFVRSGDRKVERQLKNQHNHKRFCSICKEEAK